MANDRLFRANTYWGLAYIEAFANPFLPTTTELNNATYVKDITCALWEDGTEFGLDSSETDDGYTFCTAAGSQEPTFRNPTVVFEAVRDKDRAAAGVFNTAFTLLAFPDTPFYAIHRVGKPNTSPWAVGDKIQLVRVRTDYAVDVLESGQNARIQQNFLNDDLIAWNVTIAA